MCVHSRRPWEYNHEMPQLSADSVLIWVHWASHDYILKAHMNECTLFNNVVIWVLQFRLFDFKYKLLNYYINMVFYYAICKNSIFMQYFFIQCHELYRAKDQINETLVYIYEWWYLVVEVEGWDWGGNADLVQFTWSSTIQNLRLDWGWGSKSLVW